MPFARTSHGEIHFVVEGPTDGPPVLLLHPLGGSLALWDALAAALTDRYRVIRYDMRGHGLSTPVPGDYTIDSLGRDALAVLDAAGVGTAHIVGISIGGLQTLWMGIHAPGRVRSLLVAQSAARVGTVERWEERRAQVREKGVGAVAALAMPAWFTAEFLATDPPAVERCRAMIASTSPVGYLGCCAVLRDADLRPDLSRITAPTLVLAGERDPSTTLADAELIVSAVPGARLTTLPCAHMSVAERPDEFLEIVERWLPDPVDAGV